jgi:hypothetical protein
VAVRIGAETLGAPDLEPWESDPARAITSRLGTLTTVGALGYRAPTTHELRIFGHVVVPAMRAKREGRALPGVWTRAVAGQLGYRFAAIGSEAVALFEPEGENRRGHATWLVQSTRTEGDGPTFAVEVPAPRFERGTAEAGVAVARGVRASSWLFAGVLPYASDALTDGSNTQTQLGARLDARVSYFQRIHELLLADGVRALSIRAVPAARATDEDVILSTGNEAPRVETRPAWTTAIEQAFVRRGWHIGWFDGSPGHVAFDGGGDPTLAYARRFHEGSMLLVWFSPLVRDAFINAAQDPSAVRVARMSPKAAVGDVVEHARTLPRGGRAPHCDLDRAAAPLRRYVRERNPFDLLDALHAPPGCTVVTALDRDSGAPYAIAADAREAVIVLLLQGAPTTSPAAADVPLAANEARAALALGAREVRLEVGP